MTRQKYLHVKRPRNPFEKQLLDFLVFCGSIRFFSTSLNGGQKADLSTITRKFLKIQKHFLNSRIIARIYSLFSQPLYFEVASSPNHFSTISSYLPFSFNVFKPSLIFSANFSSPFRTPTAKLSCVYGVSIIL